MLLFLRQSNILDDFKHNENYTVIKIKEDYKVVNLFYKLEEEIIDYKGKYLLKIKFKRFGNYFYLTSTNKNFLFDIKKLAIYYSKGKDLYQVQFKKNASDNNKSLKESLIESFNKEEIFKLWDNIFYHCKERTNDYYNYWIGDIESSIAFLNQYLIEEGILKDTIMLAHYSILSERNGPFPEKEETLNYRHLKYICGDNALLGLNQLIQKEDILDNKTIRVIQTILKFMPMNEIFGNVDYNIHTKSFSTKIINDNLECRNLLYLLIAREFICNYFNIKNELNFPEISVKELSDLLNLLYGYIPTNGWHEMFYYENSTAYLYSKVLDIIGDKEKAQKIILNSKSSKR